MSAKDGVSDELMAARMRAGDEGAAAWLFDKYLPLLRRRVRDRLPRRLSRKVAESDVVQEAYLGAVRRLAEFEDRGDGSFGAWLGKIVDRRIADQVRCYLAAEKRNANREISQVLDGGSPQVAGDAPSVSAPVRRLEAIGAVKMALARLSDLDRTVIELIHFQGQSLASAAHLMGTTHAAARMRYGRALVRLKRHMGEADHGA